VNSILKMLTLFSSIRICFIYWILFVDQNRTNLKIGPGGNIWHFFDTNVQILSARVFKVSKRKKQINNYFFSFLLSNSFNVFVNIKSPVQVKIFFSNENFPYCYKKIFLKILKKKISKYFLQVSIINFCCVFFFPIVICDRVTKEIIKETVDIISRDQ